ncbi:MAG: M15 family metallopeptidase [Ignavibacteriaceae bacterium]
MLNLIILFALTFYSNSFINSYNFVFQNEDKIIVDCNYSFDETISGISIPQSILKKLSLVDVEYFSFDGKLHKGQIVVNKSVVKDIKEIFEFIKKSKFPIEKVIPVAKYNWSDEASMNDNNTSAFNYRKVAGQKVLSPHAYGLAIDINPLQNPLIKRNYISPSRAFYNEKVPGTILKNSKLVKEFQNRGWQWGGRWKSSKDYQHFQK